MGQAKKVRVKLSPIFAHKKASSGLQEGSMRGKRKVAHFLILVMNLSFGAPLFAQEENPKAPEAKPGAEAKAEAKAEAPNPDESGVPDGQELVNIDFPEPTDINDIIRAVALWTGKNVILGKGVSGKVQMISPRKVTKEEAYQAFLSALNMVKATTVETGKVIKIMPMRNAIKDNLKIYQGNWAPRSDSMITQIVPLKYIDAKMLQTTLNRIVSTNSMIAYPPTNTLIISDTGFKVRRILGIIELLDVQGQQPKVALVPIRYADAKTVSQKVAEILKASDKKDSGSTSYKISVDERSNSVVIFGPPRTIQDVKDLVKKFDFPVEDPTNQAAIRVRFLNYADAKKLAGTLSSLAQSRSNNSRTRRISTPISTRNNSTNGKGGSSSASEAAVADLGENVKITADESSNALLITGSRAAYEAINGLVRKLDQKRAQVWVEVDILDVQLKNNFNFETSIFLGQGRADGTKVSYGWEGAKGIGPLIEAQRQANEGSGTVSQTAGAAAIGALGQNFTIGILSGAEVEFPGLGTVSPGGLIRMMKEDKNSRNISSPNLLTSNNETATIVVGRTLFYQSASQTALGAAGAVPKVEKEKVDLTLEIKPNISHTGNFLTLKVDLEQNDGSISTEYGVPVPDVTTRKTSQIVILKSGQTAVISGLVKHAQSESFSKIPLLGDIPILGWLFRNTAIEDTQSNLVFFITPHIVYGANDLARIYKDKLSDNQEMMAKYFGEDDKDSDFSKRIPTLADGKYIPSAFDEIEERNRRQYLNEMRRDMGFSEEEIQQLNEQTGTYPSGGGVDLPKKTPAPLFGNGSSGSESYQEDAIEDSTDEPPPSPPSGSAQSEKSDDLSPAPELPPEVEETPEPPSEPPPEPVENDGFDE